MRNKLFFLLLFVNFTLFSQEIALSYNEQEGWPIVQVDIGNQNYNFLFDTGAGITLINSNSINDLEIIEHIEIRDINKTVEDIPVAILPELKIGHKTFVDQKVAYKDIGNINKYLCDVKLDGIIGTDIMQGFMVEIDPKEKAIRFYNKDSFNTEKIKGFSKNTYRHNVPTIKIKIGRQKRFATFDTGSNSNLTLSDYKLSKFIAQNKSFTAIGNGSLGVSSDIQNSTFSEIWNKPLKFGKLTLKNQYFTLNNQSQNNLGFQFIKQFETFLDVADKTIYLKSYPNVAFEKSNLSKYRFSVNYDFDLNRYYVSHVVEDNRQLQLGDTIIAIDNKELPEEFCNLSDFLEKNMNSQMIIHIVRDGKEELIEYVNS